MVIKKYIKANTVEKIDDSDDDNDNPFDLPYRPPVAIPPLKLTKSKSSDFKNSARSSRSSKSSHTSRSPPKKE